MRWAKILVTLPFFLGFDAAAPGADDWFLRGDADGSGAISITDPILVLRYAFLGGMSPIGCLDAADADDDGAITITDGIRLLMFLFYGGTQPAAAYPNYGQDATPDGLDCQIGGGMKGIGLFFVLDKSSSMNGARFKKLQQEVIRSIAGLGPGAEFAVVFFDANLIKFPPSGLPAQATDAMKAAAVAMITSVTTGSGTCPKPALVAALNYADQSAAVRRKVLFYCDGSPACPGMDVETYAKMTVAEVKARNTGSIPIDAFAIGAEFDDAWMQAIAEDSGGEFTVIDG